MLKAIKHEEPDRVPIDLGGTDISTIMVGPYRRLGERLGIDIDPIYVTDPFQQVAIVNEKIMNSLGVDAKVINLLPKNWYEGEAYDGTPVHLPDRFRPEIQSDGSKIIRNTEGHVDLKMPKGGFFFDPVHFPLNNITHIAEIEKANELIENFDRSLWWDLAWEDLALKVKKIRENTTRLLVGSFQGHIFQAGQFLRGWDEFLIDLASNPALAEALMDRLAEAHMRAFDRYAETVGQYVDIIQVNDDLGMQDAMWISPVTYRKHIKPYHAKLYKYMKEKTNAPLFLHSDGSLYPIIPDLIEIGVDILNPVQYTAKDMELTKLKAEFGQDLCFWGAGVDTQYILPFRTPKEVEDEVKRNIEIMAPGGGFVFAAVHNITEGVPVENIIALYRTAAEYGRY
jgi:uroporphyrinogen decarboxylase